MTEFELTQLQYDILIDLLKGVPPWVIARERKCSRSNITQIKKSILKRYPELKKRIKMNGRKYLKFNINLNLTNP